MIAAVLSKPAAFGNTVVRWRGGYHRIDLAAIWFAAAAALALSGIVAVTVHR